MSAAVAGPCGRIARVRALMEERGYDAVVVRDEANLRWLTGAEGVFDFTGELPHAAFITQQETLLHTDFAVLSICFSGAPRHRYAFGRSIWTSSISLVWVGEAARAHRCHVVCCRGHHGALVFTSACCVRSRISRLR